MGPSRRVRMLVKMMSGWTVENVVSPPSSTEVIVAVESGTGSLEVQAI